MFHVHGFLSCVGVFPIETGGLFFIMSHQCVIIHVLTTQLGDGDSHSRSYLIGKQYEQHKKGLQYFWLIFPEVKERLFFISQEQITTLMQIAYRH